MLSTRIHLHSEDKKFLATYYDLCLSGFSYKCMEHKPIFGFYEMDYNTLRQTYKDGGGKQYPKRLDPEKEILLLTAFKHFWHFDKYYPDPKQIIKDNGIWYDFTSISGFDFYSSLAMLRQINMRNNIFNEYFNFSKLERCIKDKEKSCSLLYNFFIDHYTYFCDEHSLFSYGSKNGKYSFNSLITFPDSTEMIYSNYKWNNFKSLPIFDSGIIRSYYDPSNTK